MSKKRKRHQNGEESTNTNENPLPIPEVISAENEETVHEKVLSPEEVELVQKKVFYALKEMGRTFKKARDFEVRKIIKRIKSAKQANESEKVLRLEKELFIAKSLDVHPFAESYVYKRLEADPLFLQSPELLADHAPSFPEMNPQDEAIMKNLVGRLNLSGVVKVDMTMNISKIYRAAGIDIPLEAPPISKSSIPPSEIQKQPRTSPALTSSTMKSTSPTPPHNFARSDAPVPESEIGQSDNEDEDEDEPEEEEEEEEGEEESLSISPQARKKTGLLPALSTGYIAASDSDSDPDAEYNSFAPVKKIRKNKRGQRARQAIWEKKYGRAARHLNPKPQDEIPPRSKKTREKSREETGGEKISPVAVVEKEVKKVNDPHPSWVAKQRLREQQKAMATAVKPQKILFD